MTLRLLTKVYQKPSLNVGQQVYLLRPDGTRQGPYMVASLPNPGKCTLSLQDGTNVNDGLEFDTQDVEAID